MELFTKTVYSFKLLRILTSNSIKGSILNVNLFQIYIYYRPFYFFQHFQKLIERQLCLQMSVQGIY